MKLRLVWILNVDAPICNSALMGCKLIQSSKICKSWNSRGSSNFCVLKVLMADGTDCFDIDGSDYYDEDDDIDLPR